MKKILIGTLMLFCIACSIKLPTSLSKPKVLHQTDPNLTVEMISFDGLGCDMVSEGMYGCPEGNPLREMGCDSLRTPSKSLGGLEPAVPLLECEARLPYGEEKDQRMLWNDGCALPFAMRLLIQRGDTYQVIHDLTELQAVYAPIESENEALSYAVAATGFYPIYDFEVTLMHRYFVKEIEETHSQFVDGGYMVNLYHYQVCGCGPHTVSMVEVAVSPSGDLKIGEFIPVEEDPEQDGLCVD